VSNDSVEDARPVATINGKSPQWLQDLDPYGIDTLSVAALCDKFSAVCESAVDPLEVASALEFEGFNDRAVQDDYGVKDVFALARVMYRRVSRWPAAPAPPTTP
jgi:hypothetical protein